MKELISVIVPVYCAEKYLPVCVDSILAQTLREFELILVDDGSPDGSPALCDAMAARDSRVRVIHQKNGGVSAARNAGIRAAKGTYLAFVDADDWVEPDYLARLHQAMDGADLVICGVEEQQALRPQKARIPALTLRTTPSRYAANLYTNWVYNKLYVTDLVRRGNVCFPETMRRGEDACFVAAYLEQCQEVALCDEVLYHYRQTDGSAMHRFYTGVCEDEIPLMKIQYDLFHPQGSLSSGEEEAFQRWQHGKVLAILRYIARYAPDWKTQLRYTRAMLAEPLARQSFSHPPAGVGLRGKLAAFFLRWKLWYPLAMLLRQI